jgi:hypothetical protein
LKCRAIRFNGGAGPLRSILFRRCGGNILFRTMSRTLNGKIVREMTVIVTP